MKRLVLTLLCVAGLAGQEVVSRVVQLKNISPENTTAILDTIAGNKVRWRVDHPLRIVAMSGPADLVDAMEAAVKKIDVPPPVDRNVELTFYILAAGGPGESGPIPQDLSGVVQQLRNVFGLKTFQLMDTVVLRGREGRQAETNGLMRPTVKVDAAASYRVKCGRVLLPASSAPPVRIRIDGLGFNARIPLPNAGGNGYTFHEAGISTDIDINEGQKVVVGKSTVDTASQSVFLVVSGKVVD